MSVAGNKARGAAPPAGPACARPGGGACSAKMGLHGRRRVVKVRSNRRARPKISVPVQSRPRPPVQARQGRVGARRLARRAGPLPGGGRKAAPRVAAGPALHRPAAACQASQLASQAVRPALRVNQTNKRSVNQSVSKRVRRRRDQPAIMSPPGLVDTAIESAPKRGQAAAQHAAAWGRHRAPRGWPHQRICRWGGQGTQGAAAWPGPRRAARSRRQPRDGRSGPAHG